MLVLFAVEVSLLQLLTGRHRAGTCSDYKMHAASGTRDDFASGGWVLHFVNFNTFTVTYQDQIQKHIYAEYIKIKT